MKQPKNNELNRIAGSMSHLQFIIFKNMIRFLSRIHAVKNKHYLTPGQQGWYRVSDGAFSNQHSALFLRHEGMATEILRII